MEFHRRRNDDGTYASICMFCYHTLESSLKERWLAGQEFRHTLECWKKKPVRIDHVEEKEI
jgi:hypothetical protein